MSSKFPVGCLYDENPPASKISVRPLEARKIHSHFGAAIAGYRVCTNLDRPLGGPLTHRFEKDEHDENL